MPLELNIIKAQEFVRVGAHGTVDWDESCAALSKLARLCRERGVHHAMIDVRDVRSDLSYDQIAALVWTFRDSGFKDYQRLAVLYHLDPEAQARLFVACAAERGWNVRAFDGFEEAVDWLAQSEGDDDIGLEDVETEAVRKPEPPERDGDEEA